MVPTTTRSGFKKSSTAEPSRTRSPSSTSVASVSHDEMPVEVSISVSWSAFVTT